MPEEPTTPGFSNEKHPRTFPKFFLILLKTIWRLGVRLVLVLLLFLLGAFFVLEYQLHQNPHYFIDRLVAWNQWEFQAERIFWNKKGRLAFSSVRWSDWLFVRRLELDWNWVDLLWNNQIKEAHFYEPQLLTSPMIKELAEEGDPSDYEVQEIHIYRGAVILDDIGPDIPPLPIQLGQGKPLVFRGFRFGDWKDSPFLDQEQTVIWEKVLITSPYDALSPVLAIGRITLTFSWEGLLDSSIKKLEVDRPVIYLGPDLFWFADKLTQDRERGKYEVSKGWTIGSFSAREGKLAVNVFGTEGVTLPFVFESNSTKPIEFNQLDHAYLNNIFEMEEQNLSYPNYNLKIQGLKGKLEFALPLNQENADNIVPTLFADEVNWYGLKATEAWTSVTFDATGMYGKMGGRFYEGNLSSNFEVLFAGGFPWNGQFFVLKANMEPIAAELFPSHFQLTGTADGEFQIKGESTKVQEAEFSFKLLEKGIFQIDAIADLEKEIPSDWLPLYQQLATILIDSFKTYNYNRGEIKARYTPEKSSGKMILQGEQGARTFSVEVHPEESSDTKS